MSADVIKDYLVGLGFNVDLGSLSKMKSSLKDAEKSVNEMSESNSKAITKVKDSIEDFKEDSKSQEWGFKPIEENSNPLLKLKEKINKSSEDIKKTLGDTANKSKKLIDKVGKDVKPNDILGKMFPQHKNKINAFSKAISEVKKSSQTAGKDGEEAIKKFSLGSLKHLTVAIGGITAFIGAAKGVKNLLSDLANEDVQLEKLSRQLWTTKENAMGINNALNTLGVSMDDLYLSPTLLKQFNQLRKDSASMKLPKEYTENLKVVQGTGFEFKRLKQTGSMALKWIGNYILKFIAAPLNDVRKRLNSANNGLIKAIPTIAKIVGTSIGFIFRVIMTILKPILWIVDLIGLIGKGAMFLFNLIPGPVQKILKFIALIGLAIMAGPIGAILLAIAVIDDLVTAFKGGDSISGRVFKSIKEKGLGAFSSLKDSLNEYADKFKDTFSNLEDKARKVWGKIKEWSKGLWDNVKDTALDIKANFTGESKDNNPSGGYNPVPPSYSTNNTNTSNVSNSNTTNNNQTFNITGSNSSEIASKVKSIINTSARNTQGVIN